MCVGPRSVFTLWWRKENSVFLLDTKLWGGYWELVAVWYNPSTSVQGLRKTTKPLVRIVDMLLRLESLTSRTCRRAIHYTDVVIGLLGHMTSSEHRQGTWTPCPWVARRSGDRQFCIISPLWIKWVNPLKHSGYWPTLCITYCNIKTSALCEHAVYMCAVCSLQHTALTFRNSTNRFVFVSQKRCVFCDAP